MKIRQETHLLNFASTFPSFISTTPTYRTTMLSFLASFRISSKYASPSSSLERYSSFDCASVSAGGTRDWVGTEAKPCGRAGEEGRSRERMVSFRATSVPLRSSLGSGSWYDSVFYLHVTDFHSPFEQRRRGEKGLLGGVKDAPTVNPFSLATFTTSENLTFPPSPLLNSLKI